MICHTWSEHAFHAVSHLCMTSPECTQNIPEPFNVHLHLFKGLLQLNCGKPFFKSGTGQLDLSPQWPLSKYKSPLREPTALGRN